MEQYIKKSAVLGEIEKRLSYYKDLENREIISDCGISSYRAFKILKSDIESLEVKEVDLDDKGEWKNSGGFGSTWDPDSPDYCPD